MQNILYLTVNIKKIIILNSQKTKVKVFEEPKIQVESKTSLSLMYHSRRCLVDINNCKCQ